MAAFDLRSLDVPIVQAGMVGVAWHELSAAVSEAGGLGTIGGVRGPIADEVAAARRLTGRPITVNLLLPFVGPGDPPRRGAGRCRRVRPAPERVRVMAP
jgi:nitronate monooxygenase